MPSTLQWIDYDPDERDRTTRLLALFSERNARDELGLGPIRDSIADRLFPGTNTIQTRIRYMLFVPWIYRALEREQTRRADLAKEARKRQLQIIRPLLENEDRTGVFGGRSGEDIQRLPSSVYWGGLGTWGLRRFQGSLEQYHRDFERVRERRGASRRRDDGDHHDEPHPSWDPAMPEPPADFPEVVTLRLLRHESEYLRERIKLSNPTSFLAFLIARETTPVLAEAPWEHPAISDATDEHRDLLRHARFFSEVMHGAALVYSLSLAEKKGLAEKTAEHRERLDGWVKRMVDMRPQGWDLDAFWRTTRDPHHTVTPFARAFVTEWVGVARSESLDVVLSERSRTLVRNREKSLKGAGSRYVNQRALDQWQGDAGLAPMRFRWATVQRFLRDLELDGEDI